MNEGTILSDLFFSIDPLAKEYSRLKERKKERRCIFKNLETMEDDLYRVEIWKDRSKHEEIRIGDLDTIVERGDRWINMSDIKDGFDE